MNRNIIGLDLGKQTDFSALALLSWTVPDRPEPPAPMFRYPPGSPVLIEATSSRNRSPVPPRAPWRPDYGVPTLNRWPLGTSYGNVIAGLIKFLGHPVFTGAPPLLVIDGTGVGEAVVEMVAEKVQLAGIPLQWCAVTITSGNAVTLAGPGRWHVAKRQLVSVLQVLLGERRLHIAEELAEARTLTRELGTFSVKITQAGNESFESWREQDHDDLVLAVALAGWAAESGLAVEVAEEEVAVTRIEVV